jgi:hypothetical protein
VDARQRYVGGLTHPARSLAAGTPQLGPEPA